MGKSRCSNRYFDLFQGATEFCSGDSVSLSVNSSYQVLWNNQQSTSSVTIGQSSSMHATLTSCSVVQLPQIQLILLLMQILTLHLLSSADTICSGDTSFISVAPGYDL